MHRLLYILAVLASFTSFAQQNGKAQLKGKVLDSLSATPLGFATIAVYADDTKKLINGNITEENGIFSVDLPYGKYYAELNFIGFRSLRTPSFTLSKDHQVFDMGTLRLAPEVNTLDEVVVRAEKSSMVLSLDKKIFNVGKDLANAGGSATDIMMNIPSVSVDPEGNIKLRGSDNVRILIDGKPSGLVSFRGGAGLQQLQASMIDRVEIITNPSARYEAEGMGGVINIILKKDRTQGFNGSIDGIIGYYRNIGTAANFNYRHRKVNFFINYGLAIRKQPGRGGLYQEVYGPDTTLVSRQNSTSSLNNWNNTIRGGIDFFFSEKSILTGSYLYRRSDAIRIMDLTYRDYFFTEDDLLSYTTRRQDETEVEPNSEYSLIYKRTLERPGHELIGEVKFLDNWESSDQLFTQHKYNPDNSENASGGLIQRSLNDESEKQLLFQVDYILPFGKEGKFETGARSSFRDMVNDFVVTQQQPGGEYTPLPGLDNIFYYDENIHAAYGILGNKTNKISYQGGLRAEWTDVKTTLAETNQINPRKYANLFPSAHMTFDLPAENGIQISYSRRVRRPYYNDLSPFMTFSDARNFFSGNPDLNPEFSNVTEIGHIKYFESGSITSSVYNRSTTGKIERIRQVDEKGFSTTLPRNLLSEKAYGVEFTSSWSPVSWWKWDTNLNLFYADIDGTNILSTYKTSTYSWFARQTSRFNLPGKIDFQVRTNYEAPQKTAQGRRKALYYADFAVSRDILKGNGTININVLDAFNSRIQRSVTDGVNFHTESRSQQRRRQINLTVNYRIKQNKGVKKAVSTVD